MASVLQSTLDFIFSREGFLPRRKSDSYGFSIGYGHFLGKQKTTANAFLWDATLDKTQALLLAEKDLDQIIVPQISSKIKAALTQAQFDAVCSYFYNVGPYGEHAKKLSRAINKYASNVFAGEQEIREAWNTPITAKNPETGLREILSGLIVRRKMEQVLFHFSPNNQP